MKIEVLNKKEVALVLEVLEGGCDSDFVQEVYDKFSHFRDDVVMVGNRKFNGD